MVKKNNKRKSTILTLFASLVMLFAGVFAVTITRDNAEQVYADAVVSSDDVSIKEDTTPTLPEGATHWSDTLSLTLLEDGTYQVNGFNEAYATITDIVIPATASDGIAITTIKANAFSGKTTVTTITIGENITSIGYGAFSNCKAVTKLYFNATQCNDIINSSYYFQLMGTTGSGVEVVFGNGVKKIPNHIFYSSSNAPKIISVEMSDSIESIGSYAFYYCQWLTEIVIPDSVQTINYGAFTQCTGLTRLVIGSGVTSIGSQAFYSTTSLQTLTFNATQCADVGRDVRIFGNMGTSGDGVDVIFGDGVKSIPTNLFYAYNTSTGKRETCNVKSVVISDTVEIIGEYAFYYCSSITSVDLGDGLLSIGQYAFYVCKNITELVLPNTLTTIGSNAFVNLGVSEIAFPDSLTSLGSGAFSGAALTEVVTPSGVSELGSSVFSNCTKLTKIVIHEGVTKLGSNTFAGCTALTRIEFNAVNCTIQSSSSNPFEGSGTAGEGIEVIFGEGVINIPSSCFYNYSTRAEPKITRVTISSTVESIGYGAFRECTDITEIYIPDNVKILGGSAFCGCSALVKIEGGKGLTSIGANAFEKCISITQFVVPENVKTLGDYVFIDCTALTELTISENVTTLGVNSLVSRCTALTKIYFNAIECGDIYASNSSNKDVFIGGGTASVGIELIFGEGVKRIPAHLCYGQSVTSSGSTTFKYPYISKVVIPSTVESIGKKAFNGCLGLTRVEFNATACADLTTSDEVFDKAGQSGDGIEVIFGNSVTTIPAYLFYIYSATNAPNITSVTISESVEKLGKCAFYRCGFLSQLNLPNSNLEIGERAFYSCSALAELSLTSGLTIGNYGFYDIGITSIVIPNGVTMGTYVFANCKSLVSATIDGGITSLSSYLFYNCTSFTKLFGGDDLTNTGAGTFGGCTSITSLSDVLKGEITTIGGGAFTGCTGITEIIIPDSVTTIGNRAFENCTAMTKIVIGNGITKFGEYCFNSCTSLSRVEYNAVEATSSGGCFTSAGQEEIGIEVIFGEGVKTIPSVFYNATNLTNVTMSSSVTSIGSNAFSGCIRLTELEIGSGVTTIGQSVFNGCTGLTKIYFNAIECTSLKQAYSDQFNKLFAKAGQSGSGIEVIFGEGVKKIPEYLFYVYEASTNYPNVTKVTLSSTITTIEDRAFWSCKYLEEVNFVEGLLSIGNAFQTCANLKQINLPNSLTSIGGYSFRGCTALTEVVIPDNVTTIGSNAFQNCTAITRVVIGKGVTSIGTNAFDNCTALTRIEFNAVSCGNATSSSIPFKTVGSADCLVEVVCGEGVTKIPGYVFSSNPNLVSVTLSSTVETIGNYAFNGCTSLTSLTLGNSVKTIGSYAFNNHAMTELDIPSSVTSLATKSFYTTNPGMIVNLLGCVADGTKESYVELGASDVFNKAIVFVDYYDIDTYKTKNYYLNTNCVAMLMSDGFIVLDYNIDGVEDESVPGAPGEIVVLQDAVREGYEFVGWYLSSSFEDESFVGNEVEATKIMILYARYRYLGDWSTAFTYTTVSGESYVNGYDSNILSGVVDFVIPTTNSSGASVKGINGSAFTASKVHSLAFEEGSEVTTIGNSAFKNSALLSSVDFTNATMLTTIGSEAFKNCSIEGEIVLPNSVESFDYTAFDNNKITSFVIDNDNYTAIEGVVYSDDLTTIISAPDIINTNNLVLPSETTTINDYIFDGTRQLRNIEGQGVTSVGAYAFANSSVEYFKFPALETIGEGAFDNAKLITIEIGREVTNIGDRAFANNPTLTGIVLEGKLDADRTVIPAITSTLASNEGDITIYVNKSDLEAYENSDWSRFEIMGISMGTVWVVTIDLDGGQGYSEFYYVVDGKTIDFSATPTKLGFEFVTWKRVVGEELVDFVVSNGITESMTIKAIWNEIIYSIVYTTNGGEVEGESTYVQNFVLTDFGSELDQMIAIKMPIRVGYTFIGWYTNDEFDSAKVTGIYYNNLTYNQVMGGEDIYLYAKWEIITFTMQFENTTNYTIALDNNVLNPVPYGNNFGFVIVLAENYSQNTIENITVNIYTAGKGEFIQTLTNIATDTTQLHYVMENITSEYYIEVVGLVINSYKVYFVTSIEGATNMPTAIEVNWGESIDEALLSDPQLTGYTFDSWHERTLYDNGELIDANAFDFSTFIYSDITLIALYDAIEYDITLYLNGATLNGTLVDSFVIKYTIEDTIVLPINNITYNISRPGYTILGWYSDFEENDGVFEINRESITADVPRGTTGNMSFVLDFDIIEYSIFYIFNGGQYQGNYVTTFTVNDSVDLIQPTKLGYVFDGWYTDEQLMNNKISRINEGTTSNITLYAKFTENSFNITYYLNGSAFTPVSISGMTIDSNINTYNYLYTFNDTEPFTLDTTIARQGYVFKGWYDNSECTGNSIQSLPAGTIVTDKQFYAKWTPIEYTIVFDYTDLYTPTAGDTTSMKLTTEDLEIAGGSVLIEMMPTVNGYNFGGWEYNGIKYTSINLDNLDNITLTAKFIKQKYTITLLGENVEGNVALFYNDNTITSIDYGDDLIFEIKIINPRYTQSLDGLEVSYSYLLDGEYTQISDISNIYTIEDISSDIYIKIENIAINKFTVQFVTEGGSKIPAITDIVYGETITKPSNPTRAGYVFTNWYTNDECTEVFNFTTPITNDLNLYAGWQIVNYTAMLYNNINAENKEINFNIENASSISLNNNNFSIRGYEFVGFYLVNTDNIEDYEFNDEHLIENLSNIYDNVKIIARFNIITYNIYYGIDAGVNSESNPTTYNVNSNDIVLQPATKSNFRFVAWVDAQTNLVVTTITSGTIGDIYLVATFELADSNYVSIKYYANGEFYSEVAVQIGDSIANTPTAQITPKNIAGYEFVGYYLDVDYTQLFDMTTAINNSLNLYGKYQKNTYTITYLANVSDFVNPEGNKQTINIDDDFNLLDAQKEGYNFDGWYTDVEINNGVYDFTNAKRFTRVTMQDSNLVLYAKFTVITYTITYELNGGELDNLVESYTIESDSFTFGTPNKLGYNFVNWTSSGNPITGIVKGTTGNILVTANFELITYTVTYIDSKTTTTNIDSYTILTTPVLLYHNDVLGYEFLGWYNSSDVKVEVIGGGITGNLTLIAKYQIIEYTITYLLDGGVMQYTNPDKYTIETEIEHLYSPSKLGYTFIKWTDANTGIEISSVAIGTTGDLVLMANYKAVEDFAVIIYYIDGNKYLFDSVEIGSTINDIQPPNKDYYQFEGWYSDELFTNKITSNTIITSDLSLYSKFVPIMYNISYHFNDENGDVLTGVVNTNDSQFSVEKLVQFVNPSKVGYTFKQFKYNNEIISNTFGIYNNIIIIGEFELSKYSINYILNGGVAQNPEFYTIEDSITLKDATREGYTFLGWYDNETGVKVTTIDIDNPKNYTLVAKWQDNNVVFNNDDKNADVLLIIAIGTAMISICVVVGVLMDKIRRRMAFKNAQYNNEIKNHEQQLQQQQELQQQLNQLQQQQPKQNTNETKPSGGIFIIPKNILDDKDKTDNE